MFMHAIYQPPAAQQQQQFQMLVGQPQMQAQQHPHIQLLPPNNNNNNINQGIPLPIPMPINNNAIVQPTTSNTLIAAVDGNQAIEQQPDYGMQQNAEDHVGEQGADLIGGGGREIARVRQNLTIENKRQIKISKLRIDAVTWHCFFSNCSTIFLK